jgi:pyridoxal biosynthesis lyase PdxS
MNLLTVDIPEKAIVSGERRLLAAILRRAMLDYLGESEELVLEAENWLFARDVSPREYSFPWVCEALGLDARRLVDRLRSIRTSEFKNSLKGQLEGAFA